MGSQTGEEPPESPKEETKIEIPEEGSGAAEEGNAEGGGEAAEKEKYY